MFTQKTLIFALTLLVVGLAGATNLIAQNNLDPTFGNGGKVITDFSRVDRASAAALQPDGKLIVAGSSFNTASPDFLIVRYNGDGSLDNSFGNGGKVLTDFGAQDYAFAIAVQPDGKIVAAGSNFTNPISNLALARYNADGSLDSTFGSGGKVTVFNTVAYALVVQADGKLVTAGVICGGRCSFALIRYNSNGSLDSTFGSGGKVTTEFNTANALVLQADGKIVAVGSSGDGDFALARYNSNGTLDTAFGTGGKVTTDFGNFDEATDVVIQPDGKIVAAGSSGDGDEGYDFSLARYNADGTLDGTFGSGGKVITESGPSGVTGVVPRFGGLALQADGKIVAAGSVYLFGTDGTDFDLVRYYTNGTLDRTFGTGGKVTTNFGNFDEATDVVIQPDGKIVVLGSTFVGNSNSSSDIALARYLGDSVVARRTPFDFDGDGKADVSVFRPSNGEWRLNQSTNGFYATQFGLSTDKITPADYDGDGKTDVAVFRDGNWYWLNSSNGSFQAAQFGQAGDIPVPFDYTGDGRAELAVYRVGTWYTLNLANNQFNAVQFGIATDKPVVGDYDGDGRADYAVYRDDTWYLLQSTQGFGAIQFGLPTDKLVPADYDGDGKTDVAVFREGVWYLQQSSQGFTAFQFGLTTDIPAPADYDGDGRADAAVYRDGIWYLLQSTNGFSGVQFGLTNDKPVPAAYLP